MNEKKQLHAFVHGRVQGVGFRNSTRITALSLGIVGWVRNRFNGTVEVLAHGAPDKLKIFEQWLHQGNSISQIESVDVEWGEPTEIFEDFTMRMDA